MQTLHILYYRRVPFLRATNLLMELKGIYFYEKALVASTITLYNTQELAQAISQRYIINGKLYSERISN